MKRLVIVVTLCLSLDAHATEIHGETPRQRSESPSRRPEAPPEAPRSRAATEPECRAVLQALRLSPISAAPAPTEKPDPTQLRLPDELVIGGVRHQIRTAGDLGEWWNTGPTPNLPGMNASRLAARIRALRSIADDPELASQVLAWEPFAYSWEQVYRYQEATNPPPPGVAEWEAKGYRMTEDGQFVRDETVRITIRGNFTAPARADLMLAIREVAPRLKRP